MAKEFAAQGATVFLSGRTLDTVEQVAINIQKDGSIAYGAASTSAAWVGVSIAVPLPLVYSRLIWLC